MSKINKILVVDDEPMILDVLSEALTRFGYEVIVCNTAADGVKKVENADFDAAILDYHIGPDRGTIVAQAIRKHKPNVPYVYLSGFQTEEITDGAKVLQKPMRLKDLIHEVALMTNR